MNSRGEPKSVYAIAERHLLARIIALPIIIWGIPLVLVWARLGTQMIVAVLVPLALGWVMIGGIWALLIRCPACGKSPFRRGFISTPIPERVCSKCGTDLTKAVQRSRGELGSRH